MKLRVLKTGSRRSGRMVAEDLLATVLLSAFFWLVQSTMIGLELTVLLFLLILLLPIALYLLGGLKTFGRYQIFYSLMAVALALLLGFRLFGRSFTALLHGVERAVSETDQPVLFFSRAVTGKAMSTPEVFAAVCLLIFLSSAVFAASIRMSRGLLAGLYVAIPVGLGLILGLTPRLILFAGLILSLTFFLLLCQLRNGGGTLSIHSQTFQVTAALAVFLVLFSVLFMNYDQSPKAEQWSQNLNEKLHEMRYAPDEESDGMPNGDLHNANGVSYEDHDILKVTMQDPATQYLRGYIGEDFQDGAWGELAAASLSEEDQSRLIQLDDDAFYPYLMIGQLYELDTQKGFSRTQTASITIENVGAYSDVLYVPYEAAADEEFLLSMDVTPTKIYASGLNGRRDYTLTTFTPKVSDYLTTSLLGHLRSLGRTEGYEQWSEDEQVYQEYVKHNYLAIDEPYQDVVSQIGDFLAEGHGASQWRGRDAVSVLAWIRDYYDGQGYTFDYSSGAADGTDPLLTFVQEKKGYDPQFATLAALLFREAGIPAGYVEGYCITKEDLKAAKADAADYKDGNALTVTVSDWDSHAWVEIYQDGVGWIPVEVTPAYYSTGSSGGDQEEGSGAGTSDESPEGTASAGIGEEEAAESSGSSRKFLWLVLAIVAGLLLLALLALVLAHLWIRKRIARADTEEATYLGYRYLMRVLRLLRFHPDERHPERLISVLGPEYADYLDLVFRERYARTGLLLRERKEASDYVLKTTRNWRALSLQRKSIPL